MRPTIRIAVMLVLVALLGMSLVPAAVNAQSGNQWTAYYYANTDWSGNPNYINTVPYINFNWGYGSPGYGLPADNFTITYVSQAFFYAGFYDFTTTADDEVALVIDGITYIDTRGQGQSGKSQTVQISMWQGTHQVQVFYREYTESAYVFVTWAYNKGGTYPPSPQPTPPPPPSTNPSTCGPQSQTSVVTQFGDYTSCIQQGLHQSACFQSSGAWDSPNIGSIETEPQIQLWMACTPDSIASFPVSCDAQVPPASFKCSKTGAGYFPN